MKNSDNCICKNCWTHLETFNDFYNLVAQNYSEIVTIALEPEEEAEEKFQVPIDHDMIVYEGEDQRDEIEDMIKVEYINEDWIEEVSLESPHQSVKHDPQRVSTKIPSVPTPRLPRPPPIALDSADDQRIRETAIMACELCHLSVDSLREAKSHYKAQHGIDGYIICCERKFRQRCRLVEHVNTHFNFSYTCSVCDKAFDSKSYLAKHQACHDTNKQYVSGTS